MSRRIRRVERHVAGIAAGEFRELEPGGRRDEVGDLVVSINQMCSQLEGMRQTIQQSERSRLMAQLAAGLAHQLRNSLTGARMSIQLHSKRQPAAAGDETLAVALRQLTITEEQVKGLLSAGRLERSSPEFSTCASSWRMWRDWWVQHASMRSVAFVSRTETRQFRSRSKPTGQACARRCST